MYLCIRKGKQTKTEIEVVGCDGERYELGWCIIVEKLRSDRVKDYRVADPKLSGEKKGEENEKNMYQ